MKATKTFLSPGEPSAADVLEGKGIYPDTKTKPYLKCPLIILIVVSGTINSFAQTLTPTQVGKDLLYEYSKLFSFYEQYNTDSLAKQHALFRSKMISYIANNPLSLHYSFQSLIDSNVCHIATSEDGLFRIYSWDTWMGGTMHIYNGFFQFNSGGKVYSLVPEEEEGDAGCFYSRVFTLKANNRTYYLAVGNTSYSTMDAGQFIKVFTIKNHALIDTVKLFKTRKELLNSISIEFDFFSVLDRPERPVELIRYDQAKKIIYIPVVDENDQVTDRFILYQFKGKYLEHILTQKTSPLQSSLQTVERIFNSYIKHDESTDSKENKNAMGAALRSLQHHFFSKGMDVLINVWMYYDPTDFAVKELIFPIFKNNRFSAREAITKRQQNKKEWEDKNTAPFSELAYLREELSK